MTNTTTCTQKLREFAAETGTVEAPRPLPGLPEVEPFDAESMLPPVLGGFVSDVAERMQVPPDFPAASLIVVLAAAVGRRCGIRPKRYDDWLVVPNLWGVVIGRPSVLKSPAGRAAMQILERLESQAKSDYDEAVAEQKRVRPLMDAKIKAAKRLLDVAVKQGKDTGVALEMLEAAEISEPRRRRYVSNDTTVEMLGQLLADNPGGVLIFRDELTGFLRSLEKDGQQAARAFYLEAWTGIGRFTYDRIGRGTIDIEAATVSILGTIQPGKLAPYVRHAVDGGEGDDGLLQRFQVMVWPNLPRDWENVDREPDRVARDRVFEIVRRLASMDVGEDEIPFLKFDDAAQERFDSWREELENRLRGGDEHPAIESHLAKYRSLVPSLALIFHLCEYGADGAVRLTSLEMAILWAGYLESHARRVYSAAVDGASAAAKTILRRIERDDLVEPFALRDIQRKSWTGLCNKEEIQAAIDMLVEYEHLEAVQPETQKEGRPRAIRYRRRCG